MVERGGGTASYFYANELSRTCVRIVGTWWTRGDSNPWPRECDSRARPAELRAHIVTICGRRLSIPALLYSPGGVVLQEQARSPRCRSGTHPARPDPYRARPLASSAIRTGAEDRHCEVGFQRLRRGGESSRARLRRAARTALEGRDRRHPLRHGLEPAGRSMDRGAHPRDPGSRAAKTRSEVRDGPLRIRLHHVGSAERARRRRQPPLLRVEWRRFDAGPRMAAAAVRALEIFLEVCEVVARARVHGAQPARFLGATRLSRRRRPLERNKVLVAG